MAQLTPIDYLELEAIEGIVTRIGVENTIRLAIAASEHLAANHVANDPDHPVDEWCDMVAQGLTVLGYRAWVNSQKYT